jgi:hypothetical protein
LENIGVSNPDGGAPMFKPILIAFALGAVVTTPGFAQAPSLTQSCLHGADETAANRARRQQAIQYAARVNAAEGFVTPRLQMYRPLNELANLPALPAGFDVQFHTDGRTYTFSLKDTRDACHYAIFSDQDKRLYEAIPSKGEPTIVPLDTK